MFDAIVVGARCAGSPTAMLLARRGYKVPARRQGGVSERHHLDAYPVAPRRRTPRAVGTPPGLAATGLPPICRQMSFDVGPFALRGTIPDANDGKGELLFRAVTSWTA